MNGRQWRGASILAGVLISALALTSWSQTWYVVTLVGSSEGHPALEVGGGVSAPAVAALALAGAAACAVMAISPLFFRIVLAVLDVVVGACIILSAVLAISSPIATVAPAVTQATSVEGLGPISELIGSVTPTAWPFVALVSGVLLAILGIVILFTARSWPSSARRYEPVRFAPAQPPQEPGSDTAVSEWDELSGGTDPTSR